MEIQFIWHVPVCPACLENCWAPSSGKMVDPRIKFNDGIAIWENGGNYALSETQSML